MARPLMFFISVVNTMLVVFILPVPVASQGPGDSCVPQVKVRKNTVVTASCESISCPVTYCEEIPAIAWIKIDNESNYIPISEKSQVTIKQEQNGLNDLVSYLSFKNISTDHNGIYRCMINTSNFSSKSHSINVSIPVSELSCDSTSGSAELGVRWFLYLYIGLGILGLVTSVMMISILCISTYLRKAKSRRHKNAALHPKPLSTSGKSQEIPEEENNTYNAPTDDVHSEVRCLRTGNNQECTDMNRSDDGADRTQIVYASLQHPTPREASAFRYQSREQLSEYASIRIG